MSPDFFHIILFIGCCILLFVFVAYYILVRSKVRKVDVKIQKVKKGAKQLIDEKELEITRLGLILEEYHKKKAVESRIDNRVIENNQVKTQNPDVSVDLVELSKKQHELENEKSKFQEKNKKLWEQSIAVHKEKERIDSLKQEIERKHKEVTDSIKYAQRIQTALLPSDLTLSESLNDFCIFWRPRDIVSGDFYWCRQIEEYVFIVVADCTGHGVPGAFVSMLGIAFLNEIISASEEIKNIKASDVLEDLRDMVKTSLSQKGRENEQKDGMDLALCILNKKNNQLQYAGAYNPLLMVRNGELNVIKATKNPIGIFIKEKPFENHLIQVENGDLLYMYSDGYIDQFGGEGKGQKFKTKRFHELVSEISGLPLAEQRQILELQFDNWKGDDYPQLDDVLVVGIQV